MDKTIKISLEDYKIAKDIAKEERRAIKTIVSMAIGRMVLDRKYSIKKYSNFKIARKKNLTNSVL